MNYGKNVPGIKTNDPFTQASFHRRNLWMADAISSEDWNGIKEELGDLLLHIVFYAKIGTEQQKFSFNRCNQRRLRKIDCKASPYMAMCRWMAKKMLSRTGKKIKLKEGKRSVSWRRSRSLPSMVKAMRLQEKSKQVDSRGQHRPGAGAR